MALAAGEADGGGGTALPVMRAPLAFAASAPAAASRASLLLRS
jgi:hypothetical protein